MHTWILNWTQWIFQGSRPLPYTEKKLNTHILLAHLHLKCFISLYNSFLWFSKYIVLFLFKASIQLIIRFYFFYPAFFKDSIWTSGEVHMVPGSQICSWELLNLILPIEHRKTKLLCPFNYERKPMAHPHFLPNNLWIALQSYCYLPVERIYFFKWFLAGEIPAMRRQELNILRILVISPWFISFRTSISWVHVLPMEK